MNSPDQSLLGKVVGYADQYDASLLYPLPRAAQRAEIGISGQPVFWAPMCGQLTSSVG